MKSEEMTVIEVYLDSLGSTLWGRSYEINSEEGRLAASKSIYDLWESLERIADARLGESLWQISTKEKTNDGGS